jgi:hypothetical protein
MKRLLIILACYLTFHAEPARSAAIRKQQSITD